MNFIILILKYNSINTVYYKLYYYFSAVKYVKNVFGGYFLVHDGYKYLPARNLAPEKRTVGLWLCEERNKAKCIGEVKVNDKNEIISSKEHSNHPPSKKLKELKTYDHFKGTLIKFYKI